MKTNYQEFRIAELQDRIRIFKMGLTQSYSRHEKPKTRPELRPNLRKEIARIKTELFRREKKS